MCFKDKAFHERHWYRWKLKSLKKWSKKSSSIRSQPFATVCIQYPKGMFYCRGSSTINRQWTAKPREYLDDDFALDCILQACNSGFGGASWLGGNGMALLFERSLVLVLALPWDIILLENYSTACTGKVFVRFIVLYPSCMLCCLRRRRLHFAEQRSGVVLQLCSCSYMWSIETLISWHRGRW